MEIDELKEIVQKISQDRVTDIFLLSADISDFSADSFIEEAQKSEKSSDCCSLILTTYGGDPDAGFRIMRYLKRRYAKIVLYIFGTCKSTGTLMALGADEIVMSYFGELGPLDIQLTKDDELTNTSGLSYLQSLYALNERLYESFEQNFMSLKRKSGFTISTRTAAEIASKLSIGIISPISGQIDPLKLGEVNRAIRIADDYGRRLLNGKQGDTSALINRLVGEYTSHGFVIDYEEAVEVFRGTIAVRFAEDDEMKLERNLSHLVRRESGKPSIFALTELFKNRSVEQKVEAEQGNANADQDLQPQISNEHDVAEPNNGANQE